MKLLYTAFDVFPAPKGASIRIGKVLEALAPIFEVEGLFLGEPGYQATDLGPAKIPLTRLLDSSLSFLEKTVAFAETVLDKVESWNPEIVHFRSLWDAYPLCRYRQKTQRPIKLIYEIHGLPEYELCHHFPDFPASILEKIRQQQAYVLQNVDALICPSETHQAYLNSQGVWAEKIHRIGNGVDTHVFSPQVRERPEIPRIIYLGTLAPWQGLEDLLGALQQVSALFQLRLIGRGNARWQRDLLTRAFQLGLSQQVELLNPLSHELMPDLINQAEIAVAPLDNSERNCIQGCNPIKIFEYMACAKPVIAPDLPVIREIITDKVEGLLYPVGDIDGLRACIEKLLNQPELAKTLGENGRKKAVSQFQWQKRQSEIQAFYQTLQKTPLA